MKKTYITSLFLTLFGSFIFSLCLLGAKVEAAAPAWDCKAEKNGVSLEGVCFFGETAEKYQNLEFTLVNSNEDKVLTNLYFKNITTGTFNVISLTEGVNEYLVQIPVDAETNAIQTVEVYYVLDNSKVNKLTLDVMKETDAPRVVINNASEENEYKKEQTITVDVKDNFQDDVGIKSIYTAFLPENQELDEALLVEMEEVKNSQEWLTAYTFEMTYNEKENVKLWVKVEDFAGNVTIVSSDALLVDGDAPVVTANLEKADEVKASHSVDVTVTDEKSGILEVKYGWKLVEQAKEEVVLTPVTLTNGSFRMTTPSINGVYEYVIVATDKLGNTTELVSGPFEVSVGSNAIVPSFIGNTAVPSASFTANVKVAESDATSIEKIIMIWIPDGAAKPGHPSNISDYEFYQEFEIKSGEENDITFTTTDKMTGSYRLFMFVVYNEAENLFGIYDDATLLTIDTTAPNVYFVPEVLEGYVKEANIVISLTDEHTFEEALFYVWAEASVELTADEINVSTTSGSTVSLKDVTGSYRLWVKAYDKAGNEVIAHSEEYKLDNTAPVVELTEEMKDIYGKTSEVALKVTEEDSGIATVKYAWGVVGEAAPEEASFKVNKENKVYTDVVADGSYRLYVIITDNAGNETRAVFENEFVVDVQVPVIKGINQNGYYKDVVTIEAEDGNLTSIEVCNKLTDVCTTSNENKVEITESGYYVVSAIDDATNVTSASFVVNKEGKLTLGEDEYKVKSQLLLPIQKEDNRYFITLPKGEYSKSDVLVLTKFAAGSNSRLEQKNNYIILEGEVIEILARRSDTLTITDTKVISSEADANGNYGYVVVNTFSNSEANGLGINTTIIDSEALALTVGVAGTLSLIGIFVIYRSKKSLRLL